MPEVLFVKTRTGISIFFSLSCGVTANCSRPSFSLASSLILADVLSAAHEQYKSTFSTVSFNISCNKNRLEKARIGDLNLGMVGNWKHT